MSFAIETQYRINKEKFYVDIKVTNKKQKIFNNKTLIIISLIVLTVIGWRFANLDERKLISRQESLFAKVQKGDLLREGDGYGILKSNDQKLLTAMSQATIEKIVLRPGAAVNPNSVILLLNNPEIVQQVQNAKQGLRSEKANIKQMELSQKRNLLSEQVKLAELEAKYEVVKLNLTAQKNLAKLGVVSKISIDVISINEMQLAKVIAIYQNQIAQLKLVHNETIKMQLEKIKQSEGNLETAERKLTSLTVTAGMTGVLQQSFIELGQNVSAGQKLALISGTKNLVALLKIPQTQVDLIKIDQTAEIDTRRGIVQGRVQRIEPVVLEGTVNVEIDLIGDLPSNARPQLNVDGKIKIGTITNTLFIERPANIQPGTSSRLFEVGQHFTDAKAKRIKFGVETDKFIQILSHVKEHTTFIISDMSSYQDVVSVRIGK